MEAEWNRATEHLNLDLDEINRLIRDSGHLALDASLLVGGKANTNYRLALSDGGFVVLRIYQRDSQIATLEVAVTALIAGKVPTPHFLYLHSDKSFALTTWLEGETFESLATGGRQLEVDHAANDVGWALTQISSHKFSAPGFLGSDLRIVAEWSTVVDGLYGYLYACLARPLVVERGGGSLVKDIEGFSRSWEACLRQATIEPCLVHGDFKASNLLVDEGRLSGVLDWEFSHSGTFLLDIGQLFRHADCMGPSFEEGFVRGFTESGGVLPHDWRQLSRAVDLVSLVDFLGRDSSGPATVQGVLLLITGTVSP